MSDSSEGCVLDLLRFAVLGGLVLDVVFLVTGIVYWIPFLILACTMLLAPGACLVAGMVYRSRVLLRLGDLGGMLLAGVLIFSGGLVYDYPFLVLVGGAWVLFAFFLIVSAVRESRREETLAAIAKEWGLDFSPDDPIEIPRTYSALKLDSRGKTSRATNVIYGEWRKARIKVFEFSVGSPEDEKHVSEVSVVLVDTPYDFSYVAVESAGFVDRLGATFLCQDAKTGTPRFDRAFHVIANDPDFACRLLRGGVSDFLLHSWETHFKIEFAGGSIMAHKNKRLKPKALRRLVRFVVDLHERLPDDLPRAGET